MEKYQVLVNNIGEVYNGNNKNEAIETFKEYKDQSLSGYGRASFEDVSLIEDNEEIEYHFGKEIQETKDYRVTQFNKISTEYKEYKTKIKLIKPDGETNWIDITNEELEQIKNILIK